MTEREIQKEIQAFIAEERCRGLLEWCKAWAKAIDKSYEEQGDANEEQKRTDDLR